MKRLHAGRAAPGSSRKPSLVVPRAQNLARLAAQVDGTLVVQVTPQLDIADAQASGQTRSPGFSCPFCGGSGIAAPDRRITLLRQLPSRGWRHAHAAPLPDKVPKPTSPTRV